MRRGPHRTKKVPFRARISEEIWAGKYRFLPEVGGQAEEGLEDTFLRVAVAAASVEPKQAGRERAAQRYFDAMADYGFLPGGRILAGAGSGRRVTLFNCFVMGGVADDLSSIFEAVKDAALTMQQGGGIGQDFSTLRPRGALVQSIGADASGPVSFMDVWDAMCRTIMSAGARRGAMMGCLRVDHPDIETFIEAKSDPLRLRNFNVSVLVTDAFMAAVKADGAWDLVFGGKVYRTVKARDLWAKIMRAAYAYAEPGVIFIDRVNALNTLSYCETISATNPCGEQPLPPFGACLLGSLNLTAFVGAPFEADARLDEEALGLRAARAVRFLDAIIDVSNYPLPAQAAEARAKRRIGLGVTGLADALAMVGLRYGSEEAARAAQRWMSVIERAAYLESTELAREKGPYPLYDAAEVARSPNIQRLDADVRAAIAAHGLRNGCLTTVAPTGTISLLAGNVSSGIEPIFDFTYTRRVLNADGTRREELVEDYATALFYRLKGKDAPLPPAFVRAGDLEPGDHLRMQAALQAHVDSSISKTINCPEDIAFERFADIYLEAYDLGLKGCTVYRPNAVTGSVLTAVPETADAPPEDAPKGEKSSVPRSQSQAAVPVRGAPERVSPLHVSGEARLADVVYMAEPLDRDPVLSGFTYKLKWPGSDHAIYVTINDIERDGRKRPFEIFINTKNLEHYAWTVALTRMISAVFRRGGDVAFVAQELKAVFDPEGGRWIDGAYVPSVVAAIGDIIERHLVRIGFLMPADAPDAAAETVERPRETADLTAGSMRAAVGSGKRCSRCQERSLVREGGCWTCTSCGFSRCG